MKYIVSICLIFLSYFTYNTLFKSDGGALSDVELTNVLQASTKESDELKKSFEKVLKLEENYNFRSIAAEKYTVNEFEVKRDPIAEMNKLFRDESKQVSQYVQNALADEAIESVARLNLLEEYVQLETDHSKVKNVTRNVLENSVDVDLFTRALQILAKISTPEEFLNYTEKLSYRIQNPKFKEIIINFK
jgi:hypothetical protein